MIEFVGGGLGEVEGTCTNYQEIIRNIVLGTKFLKETFNFDVKHAWMPEQVGLNAAMAIIVDKMGFETLTIGRISEIEHSKRKTEQSLEFYWRPNFEAENQGSI